MLVSRLLFALGVYSYQFELFWNRGLYFSYIPHATEDVEKKQKIHLNKSKQIHLKSYILQQRLGSKKKGTKSD